MATELRPLAISPNFTSSEWISLSQLSSADWLTAIQILRDRLEGRYFRFLHHLIEDPHSGFIVLSVDCLLAETLAQFRAGFTSGDSRRGRFIKQFLAGPRFHHHFDEQARTRFYEDIRCGLLHQAEAKQMWLVRRNQPEMLQKVETESGYIIDVQKFHAAVHDSFEDYCEELLDPSCVELRSNLWIKMDDICKTRNQRGLLLDIVASSQER